MIKYSAFPKRKVQTEEQNPFGAEFFYSDKLPVARVNLLSDGEPTEFSFCGIPIKGNMVTRGIKNLIYVCPYIEEVVVEMAGDVTRGTRSELGYINTILSDKIIRKPWPFDPGWYSVKEILDKNGNEFAVERRKGGLLYIGWKVLPIEDVLLSPGVRGINISIMLDFLHSDLNFYTLDIDHRFEHIFKGYKKDYKKYQPIKSVIIKTGVHPNEQIGNVMQLVLSGKTAGDSGNGQKTPPNQHNRKEIEDGKRRV